MSRIQSAQQVVASFIAALFVSAVAVSAAVPIIPII